MHRLVIAGGRVITPFAGIEPGVVEITDRKITYVGERRDYQLPDVSDGVEYVDASGLIVSPGFIDIHVHGGGGHDVMRGRSEEVLGVAENETRSGVTAFLPSLYALSFEDMMKSIESIKEAKARQSASGDFLSRSGARIVGLHLEAPYMNPLSRGGQPIEYIREPRPEEYLRFFEAAGDLLKIILVAPEIPGGMRLIRDAAALGIVVGAGHSEASYEQVEEAVEAGLSHIIHTWNGGNTGICKRAPGLIGAALNIEELTNELIADGIHVHPANMEILFKIKGPDRVILITDAISAAGLPDGEYPMPDGRVMVVEGGVARAKGTTDGSLLGSLLGMNRGVANMIKLVGATAEEAIGMATVNPAKRIGEFEKRGSLAPGKDGDIVLLDAEFNVIATYIGGKAVYKAEQ